MGEGGTSCSTKPRASLRIGLGIGVLDSLDWVTFTPVVAEFGWELGVASPIAKGSKVGIVQDCGDGYGWGAEDR